jgi:hypothetical protein
MKLAPAVVVAGMALGWLLGSAADPVMKQPADPGLNAFPQADSAPAALPHEDWPNLSSETLRPADGYRPDLDYDAVVGSEWASPDARAEGDLAPPSSLADALDAAGKAEQAAEDAEKALVVPAPDKPEAEIGARKSELARSGLY